MNRIKIENKRFSSPSEWNELSKKQLFIWSGIIRQKITIDFALRSAVILFYNIPKSLFNRLNIAQQIQLKQSLFFLTEDNLLTKNVIGSFRLFFRRYHGPANRLSNISVLEYRRTEIYYQLYQRTGDVHFLNILCATLFRPKSRKKQDEDIRIPILEIGVNKRAYLFKWLHPNLRHSILLFYEGCRGYIIKSHKEVFKQAPQGKAPSKELMDFENIILAVSGDKFGSFAETGKTNLYVFLNHLKNRKEEAEQLKQRSK